MNAPDLEKSKSGVEKAGIEVLDRFMAALNAYDAQGMEDCMHYPHPRLAEGQISVYEGPGSNPMDLFDRLREQDGWHHSVWNDRDLIQFNADKAHWQMTYTRYREDGSVIGVYETLYVLTQKNGRWGIQLRSSFGP